MSIKILMPALSPTMTEGILQKWLVKIGDEVKSGDVLAEIETDKATMEIETVDEGIVKKLLFKEGEQSIKVNETIAIVENEGESLIKSQKKQINIDQSEEVNNPKLKI